MAEHSRPASPLCQASNTTFNSYKSAAPRREKTYTGTDGAFGAAVALGRLDGKPAMLSDGNAAALVVGGREAVVVAAVVAAEEAGTRRGESVRADPESEPSAAAAAEGAMKM